MWDNLPSLCRHLPFSACRRMQVQQCVHTRPQLCVLGWAARTPALPPGLLPTPRPCLDTSSYGDFWKILFQALTSFLWQRTEGWNSLLCALLPLLHMAELRAWAHPWARDEGSSGSLVVPHGSVFEGWGSDLSHLLWPRWKWVIAGLLQAAPLGGGDDFSAFTRYLPCCPALQRESFASFC